MSNLDKILKKVLLNMNYDSKKTLSENKKLLINETNEEWTNSYNIWNKPISFKGRQIKTVNQSLQSLVPALDVGSKTLLKLTGGDEYSIEKYGKESVKRDMDYTKKELLTFINGNAPFHVAYNNKNYYLQISCIHRVGCWYKNKYYEKCPIIFGTEPTTSCSSNKDVIGSHKYLANDGTELPVIENHVKIQPTQKPKDVELTQTLSDFEITSPKKEKTNKNKKNLDNQKNKKPNEPINNLNNVVIDDI